MKYFKRWKGGRERKTKERKQYRLVKGTRVASLIFTLVATFIASNIAIFAANTYYNLDTGEIVVDEIQRVTNAIRATGGLIVGGGATVDPAAGVAFEVAGTENILFSTSGTITQTGTGAVEFTGDVGIGGPATTYEFEVTDGDADNVVASFGGRVIGVDAVNPTDFVTLQQLTSGSGGGVLNAFVQGGNSFGATAVIGTNDAYDFELEAGGTTRLTLFDNDPDVVAAFSGRVRGVDAVEDDEFVTLLQLNDVIAGASHPAVTFAGTPNYLTLNGATQEITLTKLDISDDTNLAAGAGLTLSGNNLAVDGVLQDLDTLGAAASDGQFIVATGAGTFAYESGATARTSLGLTIGTDVQAYDAGLTQIAGLADPNADVILFWNDTSNSYDYITTYTGLTISGTTLAVNTATETVAGISEFATLAEVNAGTSATTTVRPVTLAGWTGSTNIANVGTVTTGTWQGTAIADAYIASSADWNAAFGWGNHATFGYLDGTTILGDISDVTLTSISDGELLRWNGTAWVNNTLAEAGVAAAGDLHDAVTLTGQNYLSLSGQQITVNAVDLATSNVTGTLAVDNGGTGATSFTSGGILFGAGTGAITSSGVLTDGQLLIGDGMGAPTASTLTAGTGVTIVNAPGSITISADTGSLSGTFFEQGGNTFGAKAFLGTDDAFDLALETNNVERMTIGAAGGVTVATGNDFTVTSGISNFGGDVNLTGGARTLAATAGSLFLTASGANTIRLASASTGNIEFFDANNFITSGGDLTIAGDFTLSGLTITNDGTLTTIASTGGDGLVLDSADGTIALATGDSLETSGGYDLTSGSIFREVQPIFGFDVPIRCSTSCDNGDFVTVSRAIENYAFPSAYTGTTRQHNFTIHYSDTLSSGSTNWQVYNNTTSGVVDTFTVPFSPTNDLDGSAAIFTTGDVTIPTNGDDWELRVSLPATGTLQVNQVFLGAYDVID